MKFDPGIGVVPVCKPLGFRYEPGAFGPKPETRSLDAIRPSLRDPNCAGPDPAYAIVMDIGRDKVRAELERRMLLFGAVIYSSGKLGDEPVRSQGHVHHVSSPAGGLHLRCTRFGREQPTFTCSSPRLRIRSVAMQFWPGLATSWSYLPHGPTQQSAPTLQISWLWAPFATANTVSIMTRSGNAKASLGIQSSPQTAESNGCPILSTRAPALPCGAPETIQNSAWCEELPFTNKRFGTSIGLPGSQIRLFARTFGNTSSPEGYYLSSGWSSGGVPSLDPPLAWMRSASESSRPALSSRPN